MTVVEGSAPGVACNDSAFTSGVSDSRMDVAAATLIPQLAMPLMNPRRESLRLKYSFTNSLIVITSPPGALVAGDEHPATA
jgi:hypothetical protein